MVNLRASPFHLQPSMCFWPVGLLGTLLLPVDQSGFVTPLQQFSHGRPMRSRQHEGLHRRHRCPHSASPEGTVCLAKQGNCQDTLGFLSLMRRAQRVEEKGWKIPQRSHTQASNRNNGHNLNYIFWKFGELRNRSTSLVSWSVEGWATPPASVLMTWEAGAPGTRNAAKLRRFSLTLI